MSECRDGRVYMSFAEAENRLKKGPTIHTFRNSSISLIGCDWPREDILAALKAAPEIEETGEHAQRMNHGLAITDNTGLLFIETEPGGGK